MALLGVRPARQLRSVLDSRKRFHRIGAAHNAVEFVRSQCLHESRSDHGCLPGLGAGLTACARDITRQVTQARETALKGEDERRSDALNPELTMIL